MRSHREIDPARGRRIERLRVAKLGRRSKRRLAELVGVSERTIHLWEIEGRPIELHNLMRLADVLGAQPDEIAGLDAEDPYESLLPRVARLEEMVRAVTDRLERHVAQADRDRDEILVRLEDLQLALESRVSDASTRTTSRDE